MVTLEGMKRERSEEESQHQWYSSHIIIHNPALEAHCQHVSNRLEVNICPNHTLEFTDSRLQSIKLNVFYIPEVTNQKVFDSFILLGGLLYIFKITVRLKHDINHGLLDVADKCGFPPRNQWHFVFIISPSITLTVPQPWRLALQDHSPYSVVVHVDLAQVQ